LCVTLKKKTNSSVSKNPKSFLLKNGGKVFVAFSPQRANKQKSEKTKLGGTFFLKEFCSA